MTPQITEQLTPTPPATSLPLPRSAVPPKMSLWARVATRRNVFWFLVAIGVMLNATIAYCAYILWSEPPSVEPNDQKALAVPFSGEKALLDMWRRWPVQDGGRIKPFDSFCRETVRIVTGREKFQGNDPVAVALSWIMLYRPATPESKLHYRKFDYLSRQTRENLQPQPWTVVFEHEANDLANS